MARLISLVVAGVLAGCSGPRDHGPIAEDISGSLGSIVPYATPEQVETFERGREVARRRFDLKDGLGPAFNVTFCGACHEKPTTGGSSGLYRNFFLSGVRTSGGVFFPGESAGMAGGVIRMYHFGPGEQARPVVPERTNVFAQRNAVPFFGVGLIAELDGEEILKRADPDDQDGDGISGRPNFEEGFVGRFGRKAQTASIEGFIRGPLFNHLGITTNPLTDEQRARLPVDSSSRDTDSDFGAARAALRAAQAAVGDEKLEDEDDAPDPELSTDDLFDLVSFSMLLAAPRIEELSDRAQRGLELFDEARCGDCHTPRLEGPRGPLPIYSDLLIHDMGTSLADGIEQKEATGSEFRTQPLWGLAAVGPYLHDGRAGTIEEAILMHDGEALESRILFEALTRSERDDLLEFLLSLGGRDQASDGLLEPDAPIPATNEYGGPARDLTAEELERFEQGRRLFDREFGLRSGVGGPRFNGDSCRACHFDPVIGGSGPRGVNVMRHGILNEEGDFALPAVGTILHKETTLLTDHGNVPQSEANIFEARQTPHLFGLGLIDRIPDEVVMANADPEDADGDGISGRPSWTDDGRLGRFGWKAQVPSVHEFVRDALSTELGLTLPFEDGMTFGRLQDNDGTPDPEIDLEGVENLSFFLETLAGPPRKTPMDGEKTALGERVFEDVGCAGCHVPTLEGPDGPVPLYSDLLLHEILPAETPGIEEASASMREFRTAPLWGISETAPYFHSGAADTIEQAIDLHDGEAAAVRTAFSELTDGERAALLAFLETL